MHPRTICFVSDRTGITTETLGQALLAQFEGVEGRTLTMPFVASVQEAEGVVMRINTIAAKDGVRPIIFSTLVDDEVRAVVRRADGLFLDFFDMFLGPLENELQIRSAHVRGRATPGASADPSRSARIDAMNFALANDDGAGNRDYRTAEVILVGVSRAGKTPTSLCLALQYGVFSANYPLTDEDLENGRLPKALQPYREKLHGLTVRPERMQQIRQERRPGSRYASPQQIQYEVRSALALFARQGVPYLDVTDCSVEEIASRIIERQRLERRVRV